jgi:transposase
LDDGNIWVECFVVDSRENDHAFVMSLAMSRGVEVRVENPAGSRLFQHLPLFNVLEVLKVTTTMTDACCCSQLPFGKGFIKPFELVATGMWITRMKRSCRCPGGLHEKFMVVDDNGSVRGMHLLKVSQAYTKKFAEAVINAWQAGEVTQVTSASMCCPSVSSAARDRGRHAKQSSQSGGGWQPPHL